MIALSHTQRHLHPGMHGCNHGENFLTSLHFIPLVVKQKEVRRIYAFIDLKSVDVSVRTKERVLEKIEGRRNRS